MAPTSPAASPNKKYMVPMSLWLVERSQRSSHMVRWPIKAVDCKSIYGVRLPPPQEIQ